MTPGVLSAVHNMAQATDRQTARDWLNVAVLRGLPLHRSRELMAEWDALQARQVQRIGGGS